MGQQIDKSTGGWIVKLSYSYTQISFLQQAKVLDKSMTDYAFGMIHSSLWDACEVDYLIMLIIVAMSSATISNFDFSIRIFPPVIIYDGMTLTSP